MDPALVGRVAPGVGRLVGLERGATLGGIPAELGALRAKSEDEPFPLPPGQNGPG